MRDVSVSDESTADNSIGCTWVQGQNRHIGKGDFHAEAAVDALPKRATHSSRRKANNFSPGKGFPGDKQKVKDWSEPFSNDFQIQNELQRNELATNRTVIMKAAKLLQSMENQFATDATDSAHAKEMALEEMKSHCTASQQSPFDHGDFGDQWTMQNQQQLYRFHFNELSAQIHQLKRQLHATQTELLEQLEISRDLSVI